MTSTLIRAELAPVAAVTASPSARELVGLAVPFGPVGQTSIGPLTFAAGSIRWDAANLGRVKLLRQHDQAAAAIGYATAVVETPAGLTMTFTIPPGPDGDTALAEAADGTRDGLSVGVQLDPATLATIMDKWATGDETPTAATGELVEVSQVTIPAFADARTDGSAAYAAASAAASTARQLVLANYTPTPPTPAAPATASTPGETTMTEPTTATVTATAATVPAAPTPSPLSGGAAAQVSDPAVYTFDGSGASFCRDAFRARIEMSRDAADRLDKFAAAMRGGSPAQLGALATAAVETRVTAPNYQNQGYRPEMLIAAIDKGRPLNSRVTAVNLTDATPYRLPSEGDFTGVGDHTEGTAHVAEGDLTLGEVLISPVAISGAFRLSRELIDAANPALDVVAVRAMARNYRNQTETKFAAALLAADAAAALNITTVALLSDQLSDFYDVLGEEADFIASSTSFYKSMRANVDTTGRSLLASVNPVNAIGERGAGSTGAHVDGVELVKSSTIAVNDAFLVKAADVHVGESSLLTFRFDEVEGPGVVKLALWAYYVAKVLRNTSVVQVTSAAA